MLDKEYVAVYHFPGWKIHWPMATHK